MRNGSTRPLKKQGYGLPSGPGAGGHGGGMTSGMTGGVGGGLPQAGASPYSITGGGSFILHYQGPDGKRKQLSHHKTRDEAVAAMRTHMRRMKKSVGGVHWTGEHQ